MELHERLTQLENIRDWPGLAEELEKALASTGANPEKAAYHLRLGRVQAHKVLAGVKAIKHFQDAYKLNPELAESLSAARAVFWDLAKHPKVQKFLDHELKHASSPARASAILLELGDVSSDMGDDDRALMAYAKSLAESGGKNLEASVCLADAQIDPAHWQERLAELLRASNGEDDVTSKGRLLLRAARLARRFAPEEYEALLTRSYETDPLSVQTAALYEGLLADDNRLDALEALQNRLLDSAEDQTTRALRAGVFGARWVQRHQNVDVGVRFLEDALRNDPLQEAAFFYLREAYGRQAGAWGRVIALAEEATRARTDAVYLLAQIGLICWREMNDLAGARKAFQRLAEVQPDHSTLREFEAEVGAEVGVLATTREVDILAAVAPSVAPTAAAAEAPTIPPPALQEPELPTAPPPPPQVVDDPKIGELRALLEKQEAAKRYNEFVKTLVALSALVPSAAEKIALLGKAADLYVGRFANQAEAVKVYEQILAIDPEHPAASDFLRSAYERRRDWESLLGLQRREAVRLVRGPARATKFLEIAKLATERVRKPEICSELWNEVLASDDSNVDAIMALASIHERAKDYVSFASVLEKQVGITVDAPAKIQLLAKLGALYGDRLANDDGAVGAWRALLALDPNDRRAQDALKKKYLALGRWDDLEVFYVESGKWDELIRTLEQQEAKETAAEAKTSLLFKLAQLWADRKQRPERAAKNYEKALEIDPSSLRAAEALIPIYTAANQPKPLAAVLEVKLRHEADRHERLLLLREVAALYEGKVKEPVLAFERYCAAFDLFPGDEQTRTDAERAARATSSWETLITSYRAAITSADRENDLETGTAFRLKLGRVLVDEVQRIDEALEVYRAVYDAEPEHPEALSALERLYRQTERFPELLGIYEKRRDLTSEPEEKRAIHYSIAKLYETEVRDRAKAIETYQAILEDDPSEGPALAALDVLYAELGQWQPYAETLRCRITLEADERVLTDIKFRLGQTLEKYLSDQAGALENYREILAVDAGHEGARLALEALLLVPELRADAAETLEPIYEQRGDWEKLISTLETLCTHEGDTSRRGALLRKIAHVCFGELKDHARAFSSLATALREDPKQLDIRAEMEPIAAASNRWDSLVALYAAIAAELDDQELARDYWLRIAAIDEDRELTDDAAGAYGQVLALDPTDAEALGSLEALFRRTERWNELIAVLQRRIARTDEAVLSEELLSQIARIYDEKLGKPAEAIEAFRKVLEQDPASMRGLTALDALFLRQSMWTELAENLDTQLSLASTDDAQLALMLRLAALREREMGQVDVAIEGYRAVLERESSSAEALTALERLGQQAAHEGLIADLLEPFYRHHGDHAKLIGVHEVQIRLAPDSDRRVELLHQVAQLHEDAAGNLSAAFDTYARALAEDPAGESARAQLDRVAREAGRLQDLAQVLQQQATRVQESGLAAELFTASAQVYEVDLGEVDTAIGLHRKVLELDAANLAAAEALERLLRGAERYQELSAILQRKSEILVEVDLRKEALFQAASIEEDMLQRPEEAISVYNKVLELDAEDSGALDALVRRYVGLSRWQDLLATYARKGDLGVDTTEKEAIYFAVGAVYERELTDGARAIATYERILELDPEDVAALARLDVLYEQGRNWQELRGVLGREIELAVEPAQSLGFRYRIAALYEKRLGDVARAVELYQEILITQSDHGPTLEALEGIKDGTAEPLAAAAVLEPVYEAASDWGRLIRVHEVQVTHASDPFQRVELLHRVARLHEDALGDAASAFATFARALVLDNGNEATLTNLERLAPLLGRWSEVTGLYDGELDKLVGAPDRFV
ncbi:MAG: tetratricopeptide repeat protein, partial [Myxococcales bacterium]